MNTTNKYACAPCKYRGFNKKDYERHIGTAKHKRLVQALATEALATEALATEALATEALATEALATEALATEALATEASATETNAAQETLINQVVMSETIVQEQPNNKHKCSCGKEYVHKSILEKHKRTCAKSTTITPPPTSLTNSSVSEDEVARLMKMLQDRTAEFERKIAEEKAQDEKAREERRARAQAQAQAAAATAAAGQARPQQEVINLNNVNNNREININMYLNREYNDPESISKFLKLVRPVIAYIYAGNDCSDELPLTINTFLGRIEISEKKKDDDPNAPPPFPIPKHIPMCSATLQHGVSCSLSEEIPEEEEEEDGCGDCEFCRACATNNN